MVTLQRFNGAVNSNFMELFGLAEDTKPIGFYEGHGIGNGSVFTEIDTGKVYVYDNEYRNWYEQPQGGDGHTPVKGVDYWTTEDQQAIVNDVLAALPTAEGVSY